MRTWACVMTVAMSGITMAAEPTLTNPLAGFWKPQSVEFEGQQQIDAKSGGPLTLVVKEGEYRVYYCTDPAKDVHFRLFTADVKFDVATRSFELFVKDGQKKGERRHGIYEVSSGTLKLCYGPADKPRPTTFAAPKGSHYFSEVWVAEKK